MPTVTADDGLGLYVESAGDGPLTVVLAHGWTLDRRTWHNQVADLPAAAGTPIRVVTYDQRGHGRSDPTPVAAMTIPRTGDDLAAVLRSLPAGPVVLGGHSLGGMTIMALAERHPDLFAERVAGVAFVSTSSGGLAEPTFGLSGPAAHVARRIDAAIGMRMARGADTSDPWADPRLLWPGLRLLLFGTGARRADVALAVEQVAGTPLASVTGFRAAFAEHERAAALLACRDIPTVVLVGTRDRLTPMVHSTRIAAEIPQARLVPLRGAGHLLPLERPDAVTAQLARLARLASPRVSLTER